MKNITLTLFFIISIATCFGQSLFFDELTNSTWTSESYHNDSTITTSKEIGLWNVRHSIDSLKVNGTIWTFKDGFLTINYYDCHLKKENFIASYKYQANPDKGIFKIIRNNNKVLEYAVGIISTGSYAILVRTKSKKAKATPQEITEEKLEKLQ